VYELLNDDVYVDIVLPDSFYAYFNTVSWPHHLTHLTLGIIFKKFIGVFFIVFRPFDMGRGV
jgi:hypothetical protein